jgi:hypothetical protein
MHGSIQGDLIVVPGDEDDGLCPLPEVGHNAIEEVHADGAADMEEIS